MTRLTLALALAALLLGCQPTKQKADPLNPDHVVGGGYAIEFIAPSDGTAILIDQTTGKYIATKSMEAGDDFEMSLDPSEEGVQQLFGGDPAKANLILYFVPDEPAK